MTMAAVSMSVPYPMGGELHVAAGYAHRVEPWYIRLAEGHDIPRPLLLAAIRARVAVRLRRERRGGTDAESERARSLRRRLADAPVAVRADAANEQHYEVPAEFFRLCLGPRLKYSSCMYPPGIDDLALAEDAMLALTCERARLTDGQHVLELGCGWGSLTLWMAEHYPASRITAVSNSAGQREYIEQQARARGLTNVEVITTDVTVLDMGDQRFDRVVSVEMLEHVKNHPALFSRIRSWLRPDGLFFVHVFTHRDVSFEFSEDDQSDWIGRHFFTGGTMPSDDLLLHAASGSFAVEDHWRVSGAHYARTALHWDDNLVAHRDEAIAVMERDHPGEGERWFRRWRLFFLACAGLWGYRGGNEFMVSHYLFAPIPVGAVT
jgi:cyclopropane-fatty-acyl-phospholipid synthase